MFFCIFTFDKLLYLLFKDYESNLPIPPDLGISSAGKLIHAIILKIHDNEEDFQLLALLHKSVWHQQTPTFESFGSSKHVSLPPGVSQQDFSNTCWAKNRKYFT